MPILHPDTGERVAGLQFTSPGSLSRPSLAWEQDPDTGIRHRGVQGEFSFVSNGVEVARITPDGINFIENLTLPSSTLADLDAAGIAGRLTDVTDSIGGIHKDTGTQWIQTSGFVNVKDRPFGARGDNSTDDTVAIQAALDLAPGKTIFFPEGTYRISSPLVVKSYTRIVGAGSGGNTSGVFTANNASAIRNVGTTGAINFQDQTTDTDKIVMQSSLSDIAVLGNGLTSGYGIKIQNPALVDINRAFIANHGTIGIDVLGGEFGSSWGQNFYLRNSWVTHNRTGNVRIGGAYRPTLSVIENNSILAGGKYLIYIENAWVTNIVKNELASLAFDQSIGGSGTGVQGHGIVINTATVVNIEGNSFESISGQVGTPVKHIYTGFDGDAQTTTTAAAQGVRIVGNSFNPGQPDNDLIHARQVRGLTVEGNFSQDGVAGGTNRFLVLDGQEAPWPVPDVWKNFFFAITNITPLTLLAAYTAKPLGLPTYGVTVTISANDANGNTPTSNQFKVVVTNGNAFTVANPSSFGYNDEIIIVLSNTSGGAMGVVTWGTLYKLSAWTSPATGNQRAIRFRFDPNGNWYEVWRTAADVPN